MKMLKLLFIITLFVAPVHGEDGYRLWLRFDKIKNAALLQQYRTAVSGIHLTGNSAILNTASVELKAALSGLLDRPLPIHSKPENGTLLLATQSAAADVASTSGIDYKLLGKEGFAIRTMKVNDKNIIFITANTDIGILYGSYHFLRLIQTNQDIRKFSISSAPKIQLRILNHWDNLNRTVERGYAGLSLWNWHTLPSYIDQRYIDYARANASIGINGTVLTNVNANALIITEPYLIKVAALADVFRPYGIRVYLTARFSAPVESGDLKTADPLDSNVQRWWKQNVKEIYKFVPDFGGFLVKANSEGQPGPQNYGRNHADGANMLADAVSPFGGIVMWRAFVYSNEVPEDRVKQAYTEFKSLDGKFRKNVMVQVKSGPLDFQPREPFHPLFGAMPQTPLMMEFQLTQEYLGQGTHLVYEAPLFKECLDAETYAKPGGAPVSGIVEGSIDKQNLSGIAGVTNIGNERNWTGHPFGQSNWYAFGKLAWDYSLGSADMAREWIQQTFTNDPQFIEAATNMMLSSRETMVNYMTPLGLHHIMATGHHYGPGPWVSNAGRPDWNPVYYHKADSNGIGFDRTTKGSDAISQYHEPVRAHFNNLATIDEHYLLWFHHVPWNHKMKSGRSLWEELCFKYNTGVDSVRSMQKTWNKLEGKIDKERYQQVKMLLTIQENEAVWWRDACLVYFSSVSGKAIPSNYEKPAYPLEHYMKLQFRFAPGIGGNP
ncbi:alpha-glucuronidase family glycosyl hydrolase [Flavitalea sp.]|nr:alpha-glucuronidase family glycosyl hydrolase [Flavitalea sp.]